MPATGAEPPLRLVLLAVGALLALALGDFLAEDRGVLGLGVGPVGVRCTAPTERCATPHPNRPKVKRNDRGNEEKPRALENEYEKKRNKRNELLVYLFQTNNEVY